MATPYVVVIMVGAGILLLCAAVISDRLVQKRAAQRRFYEEHPELAPKKRDTADAFIELLGRTSQLARDALKTANEETTESNTPASKPAST